jgi:hypothetical protein
MNDDLMNIGYRTRALHDLVQEMRWNDTAAKDIHTYALELHKTESQLMLAAFKAQYDVQNAVQMKVKAAISFIQQAQATSMEVEKHYKCVTDEIHRAEEQLELARQQEDTTHSQLLRIQQLITSANQVDS